MELLLIKKNIHTYSPLYGWVKEEREWGNGGNGNNNVSLPF